MAKLLILLVLIVMVVIMLSRWPRGRNHDAARRRQADKPADLRSAPLMLACAHCGVLVPQDEAVCDVAGHPYCCEAHRPRQGADQA